MKVTKSSELYRNIDELQLTVSERQAAVGAIGIAEILSVGLVRVIRFLAPIAAGVPSAPKLKHQ